MKKICCVICGKYRKIKNPKMSFTFEKTLVLFIICSRCETEDERIRKEKDSKNKLNIKLKN